MAKRRFVQDPVTLELIEVGDDYVSDRGTSTDSILWNDRQYQDIGDRRFASRSQHREYMKRHGLTTSDDFTNQWKEADKRRHEVASGVDRSRRPAIIEAYQKLRG